MMRIEINKNNIVSMMREVWEGKHPVILWYNNQHNKRTILSTEVTFLDQYYFFCELDEGKRLFLEAKPKSLFFYCETKCLSFKVEYRQEGKMMHFSLPFRIAVPENRAGKRFRFQEKDLNLVTIKFSDKKVESYNALDISHNGFSFLVNEKDLQIFQLGAEFQVSALPFSKEVNFFKLRVKNQSMIYKQTLTKGAVYRVGAEFSEKIPSLNIPFKEEAAKSGEELKSLSISDRQLLFEMPTTFLALIDQRVNKIFAENQAAEEKLFMGIHQLSSFITKQNSSYLSELNKLPSESVQALLSCCSSLLLKKYLLVLDERHRHYLYLNVEKSVSISKILEIHEFFLNFVQISKAA